MLICSDFNSVDVDHGTPTYSPTYMDNCTGTLINTSSRTTHFVNYSETIINLTLKQPLL